MSAAAFIMVMLATTCINKGCVRGRCPSRIGSVGLTVTSNSTSLSQFGMSSVPFRLLLDTRMSVNELLEL